MGGPIVRTGTTPAFWENWDKAFGKGAASAAKKKAPAKKSAKVKAPKKKPGKK